MLERKRGSFHADESIYPFNLSLTKTTATVVDVAGGEGVKFGVTGEGLYLFSIHTLGLRMKSEF